MTAAFLEKLEWNNAIQEEWPELTLDDVHQIDGRLSRLILILMLRHNIEEHEARSQVRFFVSRMWRERASEADLVTS